MKDLRKTYRFRLRPTPPQGQKLAQSAGARRFVWNWGLARWKAYYEEYGKTIPYSQLSAELTQLKKQPGMEWMKEVDSQSLQQGLGDLKQSFVGFFRKQNRYPKFKSRKTDRARFRIPQRVKVEDGKVYIPKIGWVRIHQSQPVEEKTKSATFTRDVCGHWYVSLLVEFEIPDTSLPDPNPDKIIGVDLGVKDFAVTSEGERIPPPKFYRKGQRKLRKAQKAVSRRRRGSKRRAKAINRVARIHRKIANQRGDFLHKLTTRLVSQYDGICLEDLDVRGLAKTKLAKGVMDAAMGEFRRQVEYKAEWNRKHAAVIDRFFPSSKMCSDCKAINDGLKLSQRRWRCPCGASHDRDLNAAHNIKDEGCRILAVGHTDKQNAHGQLVRPAKAGGAG